MNNNLTEIACVIDRSGSMESIRKDAIGGYNAFLQSQQALPGEARWTLVLFDHEYLVVENGVPIHQALPLDETRYVPRGTTALLDAVGRTIDDVGKRLSETPEAERPGKVIVAILTDGYENASHDYTYQTVAERISHQQDKYSWEFVCLAANQDEVLSASKLAIRAQDAIAFNATPQGTRHAYLEMNAFVTAHRRRPRRNT